MKYLFLLIAVMLVIPPTLGALASNQQNEEFKGKKTPTIILASATPESAYAYPDGTGHIDIIIDLHNNRDNVNAVLYENGSPVATAISIKGIIVFNSPVFATGEHTLNIEVYGKPLPICGNTTITCNEGILSFTI